MKNKILSALLSLVAAFGLWLYVITVVSPDSEASFDVTVEVDNEKALHEKGMMLNPDQKLTVHLKLSGNRSDLINLTDENITVKVDASKILEYNPNQQVQLNYSIAYPGNVPNNAITVVSRNPDYIELDIWPYSENTVPLEATYVGEQEEGFFISGAVFGSPQLHISGPKEMVDRVAVAKVEIDLTGVKESISQEMTFHYYDEEGKIVDGEYIVSEELGSKQQVKVDLVVQRGKEIPVTVQLIPGGGATEKDCVVQISHETIWVSGSEENLANLTQIELEPINLSAISGSAELERRVILPTNVNNITGVSKVTVKVAINGLSTKKLSVNKILPLNAGNFNATIITKNLEVVFRGPEELIDDLTAEDVTAYADFNKLSINEVPLTFKLSNRFEGVVGAIGTHKVQVTINANGQTG